ncbi:hypothetical protein AC578_9311 [Pseudocercospora eumusae]|uniref:Uncharacterized protein n=1 Tax=Pseudocercospora eumusae TaxID=321146 RepID=A0A139HNB5_9PEZI|nr:hypothetical protein AC578_9311 [Pseudocercospora eumusae]
MAELQTVAAVLDLLKVAYQAGVFLKKVKDADKIAFDLNERIKRLRGVLIGVQEVLEHRDEHEVSTQGNDAEVAARIDETVRSCRRTLEELQTKLGCSSKEQQNAGRSLLDSIKLALRHPSISRISNELEARIQILTTDLAVLQFFDNTKTSENINANHDEVLKALSTLGAQVSKANNLLSDLMRAHHEFAIHERGASAATADETFEDVSEDAIERLTEALRAAEDVHEKYSSEWLPDDRSERFQRGFQIDSPLPITTPSIRRQSIPVLSPGTIASPNPDPISIGRPVQVPEEDEDILPQEILDRYIAAYTERASKEREVEHFNQAEINLNHAIRYAQTRESYYGVPFENRAEMEEELALLYSRQRKWADAVTKVMGLLRDRTGSTGGGSEPDDQSSLVIARQNQLLASIYFERHKVNSGSELSSTTDDIESAETHAKRAFNRRWKVFGERERPVEEADQHNACIELLVRILETRDKTVEANELNKLLVEGSSMASDSIRRISTAHTQQPEEYSILDKHDILVEAIKSGDADQIKSLLAAGDLDLETCRESKTLLMHAVEQSDQGTVHKLLDPEVGADVNGKNKSGQTALHLAAMSGRHDMARCLLDHDAEMLADRKGHTPVVKAVLAGDQTMVQVFFHHEESTLEVKGSDEWSLLHYAVDKGRSEVASYLLDSCPELKDSVDRAGKTPLHHAAECEKLQLMRVLLEHRHKADVNAVDSVSRTALYLAASKPSTAHRGLLPEPETIHLSKDTLAHAKTVPYQGRA